MQMAAKFPEKRRWLFGVEGLARSDPSRQQLVSTSGAHSVEPYGQMEPRDEGVAARKEVTKEKKTIYLTSRAWEIATRCVLLCSALSTNMWRLIRRSPMYWYSLRSASMFG